MAVALDPDQQAAVDHRRGACLVLAGPGSGKTRVIVERFLALCAEGFGAERQLVLTYTVKAAAAMRARAEAAHGPFGPEVPLLNFHTFGRRVLREWGWLAEVSPAFHVADAAERWLHLDAVLAELRPRTLWNPLRPHDLVNALLDLIEKAKQELVTPAAYSAWAQRRLEEERDPAERALLERHVECAEVYARLADRYRRHAVLDYDDCILLAEQVLRDSPAARRAICEPLEFVMVDEFQDTNLAQARLVETVLGGGDDLMVVADDDQAIYKFRGASRANLERFLHDHPEHVVLTLGRNYRSTDQVVGTCRALISAAPPATRLVKTVEAQRGPGPAVELWEAPDERSEALAVAEECARLHAAGTSLSDIAWLFRRHEDMRAPMAALQETGVPYCVSGGRGYFQQPEVKDLLALLAAADDPADTQALLRCLHLPAWQVSARGRVGLVRAAADLETPLCDRLLAAGGAAALLEDPADAEAGARCAAALQELSAASLHADCRELVFEAVERSGFLGILELRSPSERAQAGANLGKIADLLEDFAQWSDDLRLRPSLRYLAILRDSGRSDEVAPSDPLEDGVALLTAHGAKGLEWPVVIVGACVDSRWPGRGGWGARLRLPDQLVDEPAPQGDSTVDEERRLLYVAATRARDRLLFTVARSYRGSGREEHVSPFLRAIAESPHAPVVTALPWRTTPPGHRPRASGEPLDIPTSTTVSELRDFAECPRRYEYRRRYRMPVRPGVRQWYGQLVHRVMERAGRLRCAGAAVDEEALVRIWQEGWGQAPGFRGAQPELRVFGEEKLRAYAATPAWSTARLAAVEQPFALPLDSTRLQGRFDRLDSPPAAAPVVVDYKTGPPPDPERAAGDLQVRAYATALARQDGVEQVAVELHCLQTAEVVRVDFDAPALQRARGHVGARAAALTEAWRERAFPPRPAAWRCRRCDFRTICDEGQAAVAAPATAAAPALTQLGDLTG